MLHLSLLDHHLWNSIHQLGLPALACCLGVVLRLGVLPWRLASWCPVFVRQSPWGFRLAWQLGAVLAVRLVSHHL